MTSTTETIAYRIWGYASPREWDCTPADVADALDIPRRAVSSTIRIKGWAGRFRSTRIDQINATMESGMMCGFDDMGAV